MPVISYVPKKFGPKNAAVIVQANEICRDYMAQGFNLTLRQLYYQFVARALIPNKDTEYDKLGSIINDARLAGQLDWDYIEDRTRYMRDNSHWSSPGSVIYSAAAGYALDKWGNQPYYVEVWIEKDALVGVLDDVCRGLDVPYFSCRGYVSQSEIWRAAMRLRRKGARKKCVIFHLGDHDPSGIDMTRDIQDRLDLFGARTSVRRIALTMEQVREYDPPPNPAKVTDSRYEGYVRIYGDESWELDALEPATLVDLIRESVVSVRDEDLWDGALKAEDRDKDLLKEAADRWADVVDFLREE